MKNLSTKKAILFFLFALVIHFSQAQTNIIINSLTVNDATPDELQNITYKLNVKNDGPQATTALQIKDLLPANMTFVSAIPEQGTYNALTGIWNIGALASGANRDLEIIAFPKVGTTGLTINNDATYFSSTPADNNPINNSLSVPVVVNFPDIIVTKTVSNSPYNEGTNLVYTVKVKNDGPTDATNVVIKDLLNSQLTYVSNTTTQGAYAPGTGLWTVGSLAKGQSRELVITAFPKIGSSGLAINNIARLESMTQNDPLIANNSASVEIIVAEVDLLLEKTVNDASPNVGQLIEYSLKLSNLGPGTGTNIVVKDILPEGLTFSSFTQIPAGTTASHSAGTITWSDPTMATGNQTLKFEVTVAAGYGAKTITNTAFVDSFQQVDPNLANNTASLPIIVNGADLSITKTVSNLAPSTGNAIVYTITVTNNGPLAGNDVQITDILPAGVSFVSATATESTYNSGTGIWGGTNLDLSVGETRTLTINATVTAVNGTLVNNTASITAQTALDGITNNNTASAYFVVGNADISLTKTVNGSIFNQGDPIVYTLTLTNNGPFPAAGFTVNDVLPAGITFVSSSATLGSYNNTTGLWTFGTSTLANGASVVLTINATVNSGTAGFTITNSANAISVQGGNNTGNDNASASFKVHGADIAITKNASAANPVEGSPLSYTITVTNNGPDATTGLVIKDKLAPNLFFNTATPTQGTYNPVNGEWNIGNLANGASVILTINTTITNGGGITNTAHVLSSTAPDNLIVNNTASVFTSALKSFKAGACIIDMGVLPQTENSGLRPYGLVYEIVQNLKLPIYWAINPNKTFGTEANKVDQPDFTVAGKTYYGGAFIIPAEFVPTVQATINSWVALYPGLTVDCNRPAFNAPINDVITSFPNAVLDQQNGDKTISAFYEPAGIPATSYRADGAPSNLNTCDDLYAMPHADPQDWTELERTTLDNFIKNNQGWLFLACHSVSALETLVDLNGDGIGDLNYLSNAGLIPWGDHSDGTLPPPYRYSIGAGQYAPSVASDPFMQFLGTVDGALQNGSEQINIPYAAGWRPTTTIAIWDHDHPQIPNPEGKAAALAYGRAFGNPDYGMIMEYTSHTFNGGSTAENTASGRIYGNFLLQAGIEFKPRVIVNVAPNTINSGDVSNFNVSVTSKSPPSIIEWTSSCGGTFSAPNSAITDFTAPYVSVATDCIIRMIVTDNCGRASFEAFSIKILPPVTQPDVNAGIVNLPIPGNVNTNDTVPTGTTYGSPVEVGTNPNDNLPVLNPDGSYTFTTPLPGVYVFDVQVCIPGQVAPCPTEKLTITVVDPNSNINPPVANTDITTTPLNTLVNIPVKANDGPGNAGGTLGLPQALTGVNAGAIATVKPDGTIDYTPASGFVGTDTFTYQICESPSGLCTTAIVEVTVLPAGAPNTTAAADDYDTTTGTIPATGSVKTNDKDPEGNAQTVTAQNKTVPEGTLVLATDGTYTFTPKAGFVGTVDLPYTTCDNGSPVACTDATLHIVVKPEPVTNPDINAGIVNLPIPGNVNTNDTVPTGTTYGSPVEVGTNPNDNLPVLNPDGSYTFTTPLPGVYVFDVQVCIPGQVAPCPTEKLTITVVDPNSNINPPVANTDITTTPLNTLVNIPVKANDGPGNAGGTLGLPQALTGVNAGAIATVKPDGTIDYTPASGFVGTDTFTYQICESPSGLCTTAIVEVTVLPAGAPNTTAAADDYNTTTGTIPATGSVKTNDKDPEGNTQTVTAQNKTLPEGVLVLGTDGSYTFTPKAGFVGTVDLPYTTCDNGSPVACTDATLHIVVKPEPVTNPDINAGIVNLPIPGNVNTNDTVPTGTTYGSPVEVGTNPNDNLPVLNPDGSYTFTTPLPGVYVFDVQVCIPGQVAPCPTEKLTITVVDPNSNINPPVANTDITTTPLNTLVNIPVKANDGPGNAGGTLGLPQALTGVNAGAIATVKPDGTIDYTPASGFVGTDTFTYQICESPSGLCTTAIVEVTVLPAGAPNTTAAADDYDTTTGTIPATGSVKTNDKDPEGNAQTVTAQNKTLPEGVLVLGTDGSYTFTPKAGFVGTVDLPYTTCDNGSPVACTDATLHIVVKPEPVTNPDINAGIVNLPIPGNVNTNDTVPTGTTYGSPVEVGTNPNDNLPVLNPDGSYTFTTPLPGVYVFDVQVCIPGQVAPCPTEKLTITVVDPNSNINPPVANTDITTTPLNTLVNIPVKANDGPGNAGGTLSLPQALTGVNAGAIATVKPDGTIDYTPAPGFVGTDVFTYVICETPSMLCVTTTVEVTVLPAGADNTTAAADDYDTTTGTTPATGSVITNDHDPEGDTQTVTAQNTTVPEGVLVLGTDGSYTFTPTAGFVGTVDLPYKICDNGTPVACTEATLHIVVKPEPVTNPDVNAGIVNLPIPGNVNTNDTVPTGTTYSSPVEVGTNPNDNLPVLNPDGSYTFTTPLPGVYVFDVQVCIPGQVAPCPTEKLTITVVDPNSNINPPVANTDITTTPLNTLVNIPVKANDGPGNVGGVLGLPTTLTGVNAGAIATVKPDGTIDYTPAPGFVGTDVFTYVICETPSMLCVTTTVEVTVLPAGADNTTAAADDYDTTTGTTPATGSVITNDHDPEGDTQTVTAQNTTVPEGVLVLGTDGSYTFTPTAGFVGTVDLPYKICDNGTPVACTEATLHIVVKPEPVTNPDVNAGIVNLPIPGNVNTNDTVPTGTTYSSPVEVGTNPNDNLPVLNPDGSYTFTTPLPGVYVFDVQVCIPGQVAPCPTEKLTITVVDPNSNINPPVANTDITTTPLNTLVNIPVKANDGPGNAGGTLGLPQALTGVNAGAIATVKPDGTIDYTPASGFVGTDTFTYQICESPSGLCTTAIVEVTVLPAGAPNTTAAADDYDTTTGTIPATGSVKTNDKDPEGNAQTVTAQNKTVPEGTLVLATDGTYTFTPKAGFVGTVDLPYTTCDNGSPVACTDATLHIVVKPEPVTNPDINAGIVNLPIPGNVNTNDTVPTGTTYGSPVEVGTNPNDNLPVLNPDGSYTFTTPLPGVYVFDVQVCIPGQVAPCPTEKLTITVVDPNSNINPPVANTDITTTPLNTLVNIPVKANDGPGNVGGVLGLPTTLTGVNAGAIATVKPDGTIDYTPASGFVGTDTFTYQICESPSGLCTTAIVEVTVLPAGAPNTTAAADDYNTTTGTIPATGSVKTNDKDPEGNTQTVTAQNKTLPEGVLVLGTDGSYTFTPKAGFVGTVDLPYTTCDNGSPVACTDATLHIVVKPEPVTNPDINAGIVNLPIPGNVNTNDTVPTGTTYGSPVEVGTNPNDNLPVLNPDGSYTFTTPLPGVYVFDVQVCIPGQVAPCPTEKLTITVVDPNSNINPPVANTDITTTPLNTLVNIPVKANDGPGNVGGVLGLPTTLTGVNAGAIATVKPDGTIDYTPAPGFVGTDTFTYQICESPSGLCTTAIVEVTVLPANAPNTTAAADDYDTTTGTTPATGSVKTNDKDPEGNAQTVTAQNKTLPEGVLVLGTDGSYTFTPKAGFIGTVDLPYTTCDNGSPVACTEATLHIVVKLCLLDIGGTIFLDNTGTNDGVNGTPVNGPTIGTGLFMTLMEGSVQKHVQPIDALGKYKFVDVLSGTYTLVLSTTATGSSIPALPATHVTVGEGGVISIGGLSSGDGSPDGKTTITADCNTITYEQLRIAASVSYLENNFGIKLAPALSVDLLSFTGKKFENAVNLSWKTANEKNFSHFELQRGSDSPLSTLNANTEFGTIGKIVGNKLSNYNYLDNNPNDGANYYRLKLVDLDGTFTLSKIVAVYFEKGGSYISVENPANNRSFEVMTNLMEPKFTLISSLGAKVEVNVTASNKGFVLKPNNAVSGVYYLNIVSNGKIVTKKVVIP